MIGPMETVKSFFILLKNRKKVSFEKKLDFEFGAKKTPKNQHNNDFLTFK